MDKIAVEFVEPVVAGIVDIPVELGLLIETMGYHILCRTLHYLHWEHHNLDNTSPFLSPL